LEKEQRLPMSLRAKPWWVGVLGGGCLAAGLLIWASGAFNLRDNLRELAFDHALPLLAGVPETSPVVVVDIDRESLARYGAWPWRRQILAELIGKIAEAKPRVIGLDILLSEPDRFSPTGLVRNLGTDADQNGIADLARRLPDGDAVLADAFRAAPTVLGFVLEPVQAKFRRARLSWRVAAWWFPTFGRRPARLVLCAHWPPRPAALAPWCSPMMRTAKCVAFRSFFWSATRRVRASPPRSCVSATTPPPISLTLRHSGCTSDR